MEEKFKGNNFSVCYTLTVIKVTEIRENLMILKLKLDNKTSGFREDEIDGTLETERN